MTKPRSHRWPIPTLFLLSPTIAELLSGSAPPDEFFHPPVFCTLTALYGSGALLIREARVRWKRPWWPTILILGAAYGILEEGLAVKSFFDPSWGDLGALAEYGRWAGVNWVWATHLTLYHAVISIAVPIQLVEMLFPEQRDQPWLRRRGRAMAWVLLIGVTLFAFFLLTPYRPAASTYLVALLATIGLIGIARRWPLRPVSPRPGRVPRPLLFALIGFLTTFGSFFIVWLSPEFQLPVGVALVALLAAAGLTAGGVRRLSHGGAWTNKHRFALVAGALMFFVVLTPLAELDQSRPDNTTGMLAVGMGTTLLLVWMWRRVRRRARRNHSEATR